MPGDRAAHRRVMTTDDSTLVVLDALRVVFSEHRVDQIDRYFAEEFVQYSPYADPGGRADLARWWSGIVHAIPDVTTDVLQTVTDGTDVAAFRTVHGTLANDLPAFGLTGRGQPIEFRVADIFRVKQGAIAAHWEIADTGPLIQLAVAG